MPTSRTGPTRWPIWLLPSILLCAALHTATSAHFEPTRIFALTEPRAPEREAVRVDVADPPNGRWPTALIVKIRNRGSASVNIAVAIRGSELRRETVPPMGLRRLDIAVPARQSSSDRFGQLEVTGSGDWLLEYVELANLYGYSSGALRFIVIPRDSHEYIRPAPAVRWLATVLLLTLGAAQLNVRHRAGRYIHISLGLLVCAFLGLALLAPLLTTYAVVTTLQTLVLFALIVQGPAVVQVFRGYVWPAITTRYRDDNRGPDLRHEERSPARSSWSRLVRVAVGLALAGGVVLVVLAHLRSLQPFFDDTDIAILGVYTDLALRGDVWLGPYSRFIWHHPGPVYFYLLGPLYWLSNQNLHSLLWTASAINLASVWLLLSRLYERGGLGIFLAGTVAVLAFLLQTDALITSAWNPHVTVLPFGALIVVCADFASTSRLAPLPLLIALASFLTQTHVGYVPCVAAMVLVSGVLRLRMKPPDEPLPVRSRPRDLAHLLVSGVILVAAWTPPVVEEFRSDSGNLTRLYQYFSAGGPSQGWEALGSFISAMSALPLGRLQVGYGERAPMDFGWLGIGVVLLQLVLLLPISWWAFKRGRHCHAALCLVSLTGSMVALWSLSRISGPILGHLAFWVSILSVTNLISILAVVTCQGWDYVRTRLLVESAWERRRLRYLPAVLVLIAAASYLPDLVGRQRLVGAGSVPVQSAFRDLHAYLNQHGLQRPSLEIARPAWGLAAGVILELSKAGKIVAVEPRWLFMFTDAFARSGREDSEFEIVVSALDAVKGLLEYEHVATGGDFTIYRRSTIDEARRLAQPVQIVRSTGTTGNPSVIADGLVLPDGTDWNAKGTLLFAAGASVTITVPGTATGVELSADGNDSWRLDCTDSGSAVTLGVMPAVAGHGLQTRQAHFRGLAACRQVTLSPRAGDGSFSVSEVTFLAASTRQAR